jgi:hypothetical protein
MTSITPFKVNANLENSCNCSWRCCFGCKHDKSAENSSECEKDKVVKTYQVTKVTEVYHHHHHKPYGNVSPKN